MIFIIRLIHLILIILILFAPFYNKQMILNVIAILIFIYYKWKIDDYCILTKLEYILSGNEKDKDGFIYRLINPLSTVSEFNELLECLTIFWIILLFIISRYK